MQSEQPAPAELHGGEPEELQRSPVGPVQVVQDDDDWDAGREPPQEPADGLVEEEPRLLRIDAVGPVAAAGGVSELGDEVGQVCGGGPEGRAGSVGLRPRHEGAQDLGPGPEGGGAVPLDTAPPRDHRPPSRGPRRQLRRQAGLADPRLAGEQGHPAPPAERLVESPVQGRKLLGSPDERVRARRARRRGGGLGRSPPVELRGLTEDVLLELAQGGCGLDTQLLDERRARPSESPQGIGLAP